MRFSRLGRQLSAGAGIIELMDDLGEALARDENMIMLGGGNPGHIPAVTEVLRREMHALLRDGDAFERLVGNYGPPQGDPRFIAAVAALARRECGWEVGPENIAVTNGSQSASFMLFNLLAGTDDAGQPSRILLPLTPEYIGYADQGIAPNLFTATRPRIERLADDLFKYSVDFDAVAVSADVAAICVSRPTNPTGNVLTDDEVAGLGALARANDVPLIVDCAYGLPFPGIVFVDATPIWDENVIVCLSLSKVGLPGVRTGIVVARPEIISALKGMNAILNLTTGGFGTALTRALIESGEILRLGREVIRPFYEDRAHRAVAQLRHNLAGLDFRIHRPEGAIFLWLWLEGLPITSHELYQRLKSRGVLVLSGHYFFPGLRDDWRHTRECIRITVSQNAAAVERGLGIIAAEVRRAYAEG